MRANKNTTPKAASKNIAPSPLKNIFTIAAILCFFAWASQSHAETYWVAASGGSTASVCADADGSTDPGVYYRTVNAAISAGCVASGTNIIQVKAGTYVESFLNVPSNLTIQGADSTPANWPIFRPTAANSTGTKANIHFSAARSNVVFRFVKLHADNYSGGGARSCWRANDGVALTGMVVEDFDCLGPATATASDTAAAFTVANLVSGMIVRRGTIVDWNSADGDPGAHGFYYRGTGLTAEQLFIENYNGYCIQFYNAGNAVIRNSFFRKNICQNGVSGGVFTQFQSENNVISQNLFIDTGIGIQASGNNGDLPNKYWSNTIWDAAGGTGISRGSSACQLVNNIIYLPSGTELGGSNTCGTETNNTTTDPSFVSP